MNTNVLDLIPGGQSPILTSQRVESITYSLRLTPYGKYGVQEIEQFLGNFQDWIYSIEISKGGKEHYHCVIWSEHYEEEIKDMIRPFLLQYFPVQSSTGKQKRGEANKQYNFSETEDLEQTVTYLLKDYGTIKYSSNVNPKTIDKLQKKSYKKFSKEDFAKQLEVLKAEFKNTSPKIGTMMEKVIQLKAVYRQPVNINQIYQMCVSYEIHNDPNAAAYYVHQFLSRFN